MYRILIYFILAFVLAGSDCGAPKSEKIIHQMSKIPKMNSPNVTRNRLCHKEPATRSQGTDFPDFHLFRENAHTYNNKNECPMI